MGKNKDRESLIRLIANTLVHEVFLKNTNRIGSKHFLASEIAEYRSQTGLIASNFNWNDGDIDYVTEKSLKKIKEKLSLKYSDIIYSETDLITRLNEFAREIMIE